MEAPEAGEDLRKLGAQLLRTNERNESLIEGLLVLAESDRGLPGKVPVRLDELAGTVLDAHEELAAEHQVTLRRKLSGTWAPGDPVLLERLIANLVSNAIKYNEPGGWVEVEVTGEPGRSALTVRNTGPHVPAEMVPALFEPFRRLGTDRVRGRGGVGLGLAIVRSIVVAHEGTIRVRPRPGGGLELEVGLPGRRGPSVEEVARAAVLRVGDQRVDGDRGGVRELQRQLDVLAVVHRARPRRSAGGSCSGSAAWSRWRGSGSTSPCA